MITVRRSGERGRSKISWLDSAHTFSFAHYYDPAHMGFGCLRVINDDRVVGGGGFDMHPHRDMEIISYVLSGELGHKDSMGHDSTIRYGDVQRMSAGTGVLHSEFNASDDKPVHFLQIWIIPDKLGYEPGYEQKFFPAEEKQGRLLLAASNSGRDGSIHIHQDIDMYAGRFSANETADFQLRPDRMAWAHVALGDITINGEKYKAGDGLACTDQALLQFTEGKGAEVILFDMPVNA